MNTKAIPKGVPLRYFEGRPDPKPLLSAPKAGKAAAKGAGKRSDKVSAETSPVEAQAAAAGAAPAIASAAVKRQRLATKTSEPAEVHPLDID